MMQFSYNNYFYFFSANLIMLDWNANIANFKFLSAKYFCFIINTLDIHIRIEFLVHTFILVLLLSLVR